MSNASDQNPAQEVEVSAKTEGQAPTPTNGQHPEPDGDGQDVLVEDALNPEEEKGFEGMNDLEGKAPSDREDLLSTLEMPVFRMPGVTSSPSRTRDDEGRPLPLSGILRGRRRIGGARDNGDATPPPIRSLMPFAVIQPPVGFEKAWLEGLPEGEAKRRKAQAVSEPEPEPAVVEEAPSEVETPEIDAPPSEPEYEDEDIKETAVLPAITPESGMAEDARSGQGEALEDSEEEDVVASAEAEAPEVEESEGSPTVPLRGLDEADLARADNEAKAEAVEAEEAVKPAPEAVKPPPTPQSKPPSKRPTPKTPPLPMAAQKATKPAARPPAKPAAKDGDLNDIVQELIDESETEKKPVSRATVPVSPPERAWFDQIFTEEYFRTLPMGFHKQTVRETQFIVNSLGVGRGGRILDLCCGFGRHTIEMAKRGYDMVGLDLSLPLLQKALNEAQRRKLSIKFIHGDVRELNFNGVFDACFSFHTSFGYFDDKTNFGILQGIHAGLKPGGRFLLEVVNRDYIIQQLPRRKWWEGSDCLFLEEVTFNYKTSVLHNKRTLIYDDSRPPWEQFIYIRLFSLHELQSMIRMAGFKVLEVSGTITGRGAFFGPHSPHILILGEKAR